MNGKQLVGEENNLESNKAKNSHSKVNYFWSVMLQWENLKKKNYGAVLRIIWLYEEKSY